MRQSRSLVALLVIPALVAGCAAESNPDDVSSSESGLGSSQSSLGASDGPFSASITTYVDAAGVQRQNLRLGYTEALDSSFLACHQFPYQRDIAAVFVTGPEGARLATNLPMRVNCPRSYGDNGGVSNNAFLIVERDESPELWDTLFPPQADGSRWYAMRLAARSANGAWDSRFGADYRLILRPQ
jgi:hypothetical protein